MKLIRTQTLGALALAALLTTSGTASADLIYLGTTQDLGSGIGGQLTLLSFSATGAQNTSASAAIIRNNGSDQVLEGAGTQTQGGGVNQTRTFGAAGITNGSEFALVWNLNESGTGGQVTLTNLSVAFYGADNSLLHVASLNTSTCPTVDCTFTEVAGGIGGQGHVFGLDAVQIGFVNGFGDTANIRVGLGTGNAFVAFTGDNGGFETFNLARRTGDDVVVPEPTTLLLMGVGLIGVARASRKRQ